MSDSLLQRIQDACNKAAGIMDPEIRSLYEEARQIPAGTLMVHEPCQVGTSFFEKRTVFKLQRVTTDPDKSEVRYFIDAKEYVHAYDFYWEPREWCFDKVLTDIRDGCFFAHPRSSNYITRVATEDELTEYNMKGLIDL